MTRGSLIKHVQTVRGANDNGSARAAACRQATHDANTGQLVVLC